jgi:hypothetical protein
MFKYKIKKVDIFLILFWVYLIFFFSKSFPDKLFTESIFKINLYSILPSIFTYIIFPILLILIFKVRKKIKVSLPVKIYFVYVLTIIGGFLIIYSNEFRLSFYLHFIYIYILVILFIIYFESNSSSKKLEYLIYSTISVSAIITFFFLFNNIIYGENAISILDINFFINTNGLSRHHLIFYIALLIWLLSKKFDLTLSHVLFFILCSYLTYRIISLQSRTVFIALLAGSVILVFLLRKNLVRNLILIFCIISTAFIIIFIKNHNYNFKETRLYFFQGEIVNYKKLNNSDSIVNDNILKGYSKENILSTGRLQKWEDLSDYSIKNNLLGAGPEADRLILEKKFGYSKNHGNDAASSIIYALTSGGIIGLVILIIFYARIFYNCYILIFEMRVFEKRNITIKIAVALVGFLIWRSFFESSFASINFDFFLMMSLISYIEHFLKSYVEKK